jgi:adenylate cyclase
MGLEIERRFLVTGDGWRHGAQPGAVVQGYLSTDPGRVVRVRLADGGAWLTVKGPADGPARAEFEYPVPSEDASELLALCGAAVVEKLRWRLRHAGRDWVVDEFDGANRGLVLAEIELAAADQPFALPSWVGAEVTDDHRYSNVSLALRPWPAFAAPGPGGHPDEGPGAGSAGPPEA